MDIKALVIDAFTQLGIQAQMVVGAATASDPDLILEPKGVATQITVKYRSLVTDDVAEKLLPAPPSGAVLLVVGDRVTEAARALLIAHGGGYFDLRGRLALHTGRLVVDAGVEPVTERAERSHGVSGKAGLEVATALLMRAERAVAVRDLARELGRSSSTVSEILAALRRDGLTDATNGVSGTELFWAVASRWPTSRTLLESLPGSGDASLTQPLRLGLDDVATEVGWALTDTAAAAAYGAPLAFRSGQVFDFFVPDTSIVRRATNLLGRPGTPSAARATVRVAPVPAAVQRRVASDSRPVEWPLAHPLFVALDLAADVGRGREILDAWTPEDRWTRVW